jgi:hypothetical protein
MKEINRKHKELEDALSDTQRSIYALGSAAGAIIGYNKKKNKIRNTILGTGLGLAGAYFVDKATEKIRNENKDVLKQKLEDELTSLNESLTNINKEIAALGLQSIGVVKYITKIIEVPAEQANKEVNEKQKENAVLHEDVKNDDTKNLIIAPDSKIVKSTDLDKIKFEEIPFTGKWFDFFGNPSPNFLCLIFGLPGSGKSTFSISFAKYLAENFGLVVYISGEEGISKTLKDKLNLTGAKSDYLYIADWRSYAAITENLKKDPFNFIFIDSLDTLKIGPDELRILRNMHSNSAFVTIAQSTKDGKMCGSQELNHDSDITVQVDKGTAVSIKNRFKESGKEFGIFK